MPTKILYQVSCKPQQLQMWWLRLPRSKSKKVRLHSALSAVPPSRLIRQKLANLKRQTRLTSSSKERDIPSTSLTTQSCWLNSKSLAIRSVENPYPPKILWTTLDWPMSSVECLIITRWLQPMPSYTPRKRQEYLWTLWLLSIGQRPS